MSQDTLYQEVEMMLNTQIAPDVRASTRQRLALLVTGMLKARHAAPARIAKAVARLRLSDAKAESIERRIRRLSNDEQIQDVLCFHPFARHHLCLGKPRHLTLIIDPTTQQDHLVMLTVAVWYRGRALPLAWAVWEGNVPLEGESFWERVAMLLAIVADILPPNIPVTWLADRAFGTPQFTDLLVPYGWHYVVRVQGQTHCRDVMGRERAFQDCVQRKRQRYKGHGEAFKKRGWRAVSVVIYWGRRHKTPLCLVSDLPPEWDLIALYRQRYPIEATFRDFKSAGWQWEQGQVRDLAHIARLLVGIALASWITLLIGTQVAQAHLEHATLGKRRTRPIWGKYSLFTLGLDAVHDFWAGIQEVIWDCLQLKWVDQTWQTQVYQTFSYAFVWQPLRHR